MGKITGVFGNKTSGVVGGENRRIVGIDVRTKAKLRAWTKLESKSLRKGKIPGAVGDRALGVVGEVGRVTELKVEGASVDKTPGVVDSGATDV